MNYNFEVEQKIENFFTKCKDKGIYKKDNALVMLYEDENENLVAVGICDYRNFEIDFHRNELLRDEFFDTRALIRWNIESSTYYDGDIDVIDGFIEYLDENTLDKSAMNILSSEELTELKSLVVEYDNTLIKLDKFIHTVREYAAEFEQSENPDKFILSVKAAMDNLSIGSELQEIILVNLVIWIEFSFNNKYADWIDNQQYVE